MKNVVDFLTGNHILNVGIICWFAAQLIKIVIELFKTEKLKLSLLMASGGMPSSHSALIVGVTTAIGKVSGTGSPLFALAVAVSCIVMYDASGVRNETGKQAKILNYIMKNWHGTPPEIFTKELKELIGHSPFEVLAGATLGLLLGLVL